MVIEVYYCILYDKLEVTYVDAPSMIKIIKFLILAALNSKAYE